LLNKININSEINKISDPFGDLLPIITLNSLNKVNLIKLSITITLEDTTHKDEDITIAKIDIEIQFREINEFVDGSKIEKRLLIMFIFYFFLCIFHLVSSLFQS